MAERKVIGYIMRVELGEDKGFFSGKNRQTGAPKVRQRSAYVMDEKRLAWAKDVLDNWGGDCTWQIDTIYEGSDVDVG